MTKKATDTEPWTTLGGALPDPASAGDDLLWREFSAFFAWYEKHATASRRNYLILRSLVLVLGAAVTVLAAVSAPPVVTASLAAAIVVAEGFQQLLQFHPNWVAYRRAAEEMRQHAFLFAAKSPPYDGDDRNVLLAEVMLAVTSAESAAWATTVRQLTAPAQPPTTTS